MRGLYAIVDPDRCAGRDPVAVAHAILRGGCAVLQLRAKRLADGPRLALARQLGVVCRAAGVPFVVNDRVDLALLADADGVHLGQDDVTPPEARRIVGRMQIGVSTHSLAQALDAVRNGADLIGFGPVYETLTKDDPDPVVGIAELRQVCTQVRVPVVAIGGITRDRARECAAAGATLVAAISAVCGAEDPETAARQMHAAARGTSP